MELLEFDGKLEPADTHRPKKRRRSSANVVRKKQQSHIVADLDSFSPIFESITISPGWVSVTPSYSFFVFD